MEGLIMAVKLRLKRMGAKKDHYIELLQQTQEVQEMVDLLK